MASTVRMKTQVAFGVGAAAEASVNIVFYARYRIDKNRHTQVQRELDDRRMAMAAEG
ncbi:MAG: hypothetical protein OEZ06_11355 [Myxococcales bacterium]|nr:hypothetical protein [Myxococcales bacterium]